MFLIHIEARISYISICMYICAQDLVYDHPSVREDLPKAFLNCLKKPQAACDNAVCVVMCATCGHGDFPQNAGLFWSSLSSPQLAAKELCGLRFCVFGMGDRSYADSFCEAAKKIEDGSGDDPRSVYY